MMLISFIFQLSSHQHECPKAQVSCQFQRYGCTFKVILNLPSVLRVLCLLCVLFYCLNVSAVFKGLNQVMRQHESTFVAEHLRMMVNRNSVLENKVSMVTTLTMRVGLASVHRMTFVLYLQVDDLKGELLERLKVLPTFSSHMSELENQHDELREKNRQMEQKLAAMQVKLIKLLVQLKVKPVMATQ